MIKKLLFFVFTLSILNSNYILAQAPEGFNYQCVLRDNSGQPIANQTVGVQFNILQGSATGASVYTESHSTTTNGYGLITLTIGAGTTTDDLSTVDWGNGPYFIHVEADANGGTNYSDVSTTQMMSVPYALYAKYGEDADTDATNEIQDISLTGTDLSISSGSTVDLSSIQDGVNDADSDPTNEIELPATGNTNDVLTWNGTSWVAQANDGVNDADMDATNEIQDISLSGTDLSISSGSTVDLSTILDDGDWTISGNNIFSTVSGNVGIGTSNPTGKLHIQQDGSSISDGIKFTSFVTSGQDWYQYMNGTDDLAFRDDGTDVMVIQNSTGNVGIGTNSPLTPLDVEGTVRTGWNGYAEKIIIRPSDIIVQNESSTFSNLSYNGGSIRVNNGADAYVNVVIPPGYYCSGYHIYLDNAMDDFEIYSNDIQNTNGTQIGTTLDVSAVTQFFDNFSQTTNLEGGDENWLTFKFINDGSNQFIFNGMKVWITKCTSGCGL